MRQTARRAVLATLFATTAISAAPVLAQETPAEGSANDLDAIVVTAQKRSENLQNVPISIQALGTQKLDQLNISDFKGYAQQLPSVSFQALGGTPGTNVIYMRGVASGGDGNHSGTLPSVGVYLDEQPVTTVGGNLDVHIYDIARIESLAGPQGTLYGASSEAGTMRIITNKPSTKAFEGRADGEVNTVRNGGIGGKLEGMINAPLSNNAALRVIGFYQRDAGYIDNVPGTRTFCGTTLYDDDTGLANGCIRDGITVNNAARVKKDYNETETWGGRAALKVDLDDNWTVTPSVIYQDTRSDGFFAYDPSVGDLQVQHFLPEYRKDKFVQAALTIEGKLGNWDVTYAGAYLDRKVASSNDYVDYAEAYDSMYESVGGVAYYFAYKNAAGDTIDSSQQVVATAHFTKLSHELRVASPATDRFRVVAGAFYQRQTNAISEDYQIANLAPLLSVNGRPGTLWLTQQDRVDTDYAMFGELSYDLTDTVTFTAGGRAFIYDNSLIGFFGFGRNPAYIQGQPGNPPPNAAFSSRTGVAGCFTTSGTRLRDAQLAGQVDTTLLPAEVAGGPCTNLGVYSNGSILPVKAKGSGATYRFNLNWKPTSGLLVYGTVSRGFRPGGINRRADVDPYDPDYLLNFEMGWKATLAPGIRLNGAVYQQEWKKFQFAFLGANSFTEIQNGPNARIRGVEMDLTANRGPLSLNISGAYTDAKTTQNLCSIDDPTFECTGFDLDGRPVLVTAPKGTRLPITPRWKFSGTLRYTADMGTAKVYGQVNAAYQSRISSDIRKNIYKTYPFDETRNPGEEIGRLEEYATVNLAVGADWNNFNIELFVSNLFDERGQISRFLTCGSCGQRPYIVPSTPRTIGLRIGTEF